MATPRLFLRSATGLALALLLACSGEGCGGGYVIDYPDWSFIEPDHPRLAPSVASSLDAAICTDWLPIGSQGYLNAATALSRIDDLPGVDISVETRNIVCGPDTVLFAAPPPADLVVAIVSDTCLGGALNATAGVCYYEPDATGLPQWSISDCASLGGCEATSAVLMLRESNYSSGDEPSIGVIAHELGHALGMLHGYRSTDDCLANVTTALQRAVDQQHLMSLTVVRGNGRGIVHGDDGRTGRISAYTLGYLQERYPAASIAYATPEWYAHEMIILRDTCGQEQPVTPATTLEWRDHHPATLCLDAGTQRFVNCTTGTAPTFTLQFSSVSGVNCKDGAHARLLVDGVELAQSADFVPDCTTPLVQYSWTLQPTLDASIAPGPLPVQVTFTMEIVPNASAAEGHSADNAMAMTVTLEP